MPNKRFGAIFLIKNLKNYLGGFFDKFVVVGGVFGHELAALQVLIDADAGPRVDGGILLLGFGELWCLPVGELLALADLLLEQDGVNLLQAHVGYLILLDQLLQFNKASWLQPWADV